MKFQVTQESGYSVIRSKVEKLDAIQAPELKSELVILNKQGVNNIIIDLSETRYCDSSGLSAILTANRLCKDSSGKMILCGLQESVSKMIAIAQLDKVLHIVSSLDLAIADVPV